MTNFLGGLPEKRTCSRSRMSTDRPESNYKPSPQNPQRLSRSSSNQPSHVPHSDPASQASPKRAQQDEATPPDAQRQPAATNWGKLDQPSDTTHPSTPEYTRPRQVIAVSASKGPAAFFNLARKFLVTDEVCDLSALEGAIVSAADAAHLLERSQLATIIR